MIEYILLHNTPVKDKPDIDELVRDLKRYIDEYDYSDKIKKNYVINNINAIINAQANIDNTERVRLKSYVEI